MIAASPAASRRCDFLCGRFRACIRVVNPRSVLCVLWDELPSRMLHVHILQNSYCEHCSRKTSKGEQARAYRLNGKHRVQTPAQWHPAVASVFCAAG